MFIPYFRAYLIDKGFRRRFFYSEFLRYRALVLALSSKLQVSLTLLYFCLPKIKVRLG